MRASDQATSYSAVPFEWSRLGTRVMAYVKDAQKERAQIQGIATESTLIRNWKYAEREREIQPVTKRLALAVLLQAVKDAHKKGPIGDAAIEWLTTPSAGLDLWRTQAGIAALPPAEEIAAWRLSPTEPQWKPIGSVGGNATGSSTPSDEEW